jgi:hypothetical protein
MTVLSSEQQDVVAAQLNPLCVIACAGSGKTRTAVHRLAEIRRRLGDSRCRVVLLSFSNTAVNTFQTDYAVLVDTVRDGSIFSRVEIDTIDGFITANVLRPHSYRTMACPVSAFLVSGDENFLQGFKFDTGTFPQTIDQMKVGFSGGQPHFYWTYYEQVKSIERATAEALVERLGRTGAYTHDLGRYWCYRTLREQPGILRALARRYPHILVDEAQDIGTSHQAILELLAAAGVQISLIGDPNQGIYEFAGADGGYLKHYATRDGVSRYGLTRNYRSVPSILTLANALTSHADTPDRASPAMLHGAFFIPYRSDQWPRLIDAFCVALQSANLRRANSAIVCRAKRLANDVAGVKPPVGQGIPKLLAHAAVLRDGLGDYAGAFRATAAALIGLLADPPKDFLMRIIQAARFPETRNVRRDIWGFTKSADTGLPSAMLLAETQWHPLLLSRIRALLVVLEAKHGLASVDNVGQKLSKRGLPNTPLMASPDLLTTQSEPLRVDTVHQVKGESLDAVLYIANKEHVRALIAGVDSELGRIGYVALTRTRDLFWLAVPANCLEELREDLMARGFREAGARFC